MTQETLDVLLKHDYGGEAQGHNNYSGRGMSGKQTQGIEVPDLKYFFNLLGETMTAGDEQDLFIVSEYLNDIQWDNLGLNMIIY